MFCLRGIGLFTLICLVGCSQPEPVERTRYVRAMELEQEKQVELYAFPGRTRAEGRANLSFRVDGPLVE